MISQLNNILKKIFNNDETIIFSLVILVFFVIVYAFGSILTPFLLSIIVAYLLVGLQKKIEAFNISKNIALIITFSIFIVTGAALLVWLVPLLYIQLQDFVLEVPGLFNDFLNFVSNLPAQFPDLVSSEQISIFFQAVSDEIAVIAQNIVKSSISGIQSAITLLIYIILFPILVFFFLFDRSNIINGLIKLIPGEREMLSKIWSEMDIQLSNYVRGKTLEIFIVGIVAAIIFSSIGLKYSALLSVLVGLSVLYPTSALF